MIILDNNVLGITLSPYYSLTSVLYASIGHHTNISVFNMLISQCAADNRLLPTTANYPQLPSYAIRVKRWPGKKEIAHIISIIHIVRVHSTAPAHPVRLIAFPLPRPHSSGPVRIFTGTHSHHYNIPTVLAAVFVASFRRRVLQLVCQSRQTQFIH